MKFKLTLLLAIICISLAYILTNKQNEVSVVNSESISKTEAEEIVKALPEIDTIMRDTEQKWFVMAEDRNDEHFYVQIAEVVENSDSNSHTATYNWYKVSKENGEIICSMFNYDEDGKLIKEGDVNKSCL